MNTAPALRDWPVLLFITGMSGSGKSVALHVLEDLGCYCVDNLPLELLPAFMQLARGTGTLAERCRQGGVAMAIDVRSGAGLVDFPQLLEEMRQTGVNARLFFLDTATPKLIQRFSETRRKHPLSSERAVPENAPENAAADVFNRKPALLEAITNERAILAPLREHAIVIDTSLMRPSDLKTVVRDLFPEKNAGDARQGHQGLAPNQLTVVLQSFGFKRGLPLDVDYVFDVRMLPNPHYETALRPLTGRDAAVAHWLAQQADVRDMQADIQGFLYRWLNKMVEDHRSYVCVGIGCTGGQHRSVFLVERLAKELRGFWNVVVRHREIAG